MKKIINKPENLVLEMCNGIVTAHSDLELIRKYKVIKKKEINKEKVTLISGGGSGHEPAHAGFIGKGMIDCAVCGDVFASPSQIQIYKALTETVSDKGTLLVIKNYSGDMMNFKNAARLAEEDGIVVDFVKVNDDIAVEDSLYTVGKRGVAGTVLVHKVAGAKAQTGASLAEVKAAAENAIKNLASIGFALSSCTVPAKGTPTFDIEDGEMEYGVGIHGEPGISRQETISADELAEKMVNDLVANQELTDKDEITLLLNGFGSTPLMELYLFCNSVMKVLEEKQINVYRIFVGNYMTSIDMLGASLTFMKMNDELKELVDAECETPALRVTGEAPAVSYEALDPVGANKTETYEMLVGEEAAVIKDVITYENVKYMVDKMGQIIIDNEVPFCELDSFAGDGDFGMSVSKGFRKVKDEWQELIQAENISDFLLESSMIIMENCGGASGPIWGSAFRAAAKYASPTSEMTLEEFAKMIEAALLGIQKTGEYSFGRGAVIGDKTLVDALAPFSSALLENTDKDIKVAFEKAAMASVAGAESTKEIVARMGRAGTVGERSLGYPDAGAHALGVIFTEIYNSLVFN
ncbi:MAG: dihydroxyacetone kinase subunit DhaK [Eubacteriales bacterium]